MPTLAFDTSTSIGAVAVIDGGRLLAERSWNRDTSHGELLTPAIQETLQTAGLAFPQITRLIVGIGPGSFTGCRISVNVARALSFSLKVSVYPVDTFELIAAGVPEKSQPLLVALRGQKNSTFASIFAWKIDRWTQAQSLGSFSMSELDQRLDQRLYQRLVEHLDQYCRQNRHPHLDETPNRYVAVGSAFLGTELSEGLTAKVTRDPELRDQVESSSFLNLDRQIDLDQRAPSDWKTLQALYLRASSAEEKRDEGLGTRGS